MRKLGNLIGHFKYPNDDKEQINLNPSLVAIYLISKTDDGNISKEIPIPPDGIFEELPEFDDVIRDLYEEQLVFQQKSQMVNS